MELPMRRTFQSILLTLIAAGVLLDPYTWRGTGSDAVSRAPWWQIALAILSLALLGLAALSVWNRQSTRLASAVLAEALLSLISSAALVERDGLNRFVHGFGAEQLLSLYLLLMACRLILLYSALPRSADLKSVT